MKLLATGGCGFVVGNIARRVLETDPTASVLVLDTATPDELVSRYFAPYETRVSFVRASVTNPKDLQDIDLSGLTHVVHGATVTNYTDAELNAPERFIEVNVIGTINMLRRAATEPTLRRFVSLSSGAVYGDPTEQSPETPQPEDGPFNPPDLYAISKFAAERAAMRCGALLDIDVRAVRPSDVFGPMERPTSVRNSMSLPYKMVGATLAARPITVTRASLTGGGDFISAEDVADAVVRILKATSLRSDVYNVALGTYTRVATLFEEFAKVAPEFRWEIVDDHPEVAIDPANRRARWNAYATTRLREDVQWEPRPLTTQLAAYLRWATDARSAVPADNKQR